MKKYRRYFSLVVLIAVPLFCCSCPIPLYWPKNVGLQVDSSGVKPGVTTKEDFFLRFGDRFYPIDDNERLFRTGFSDADAFLLVLALPYGVVPVYGKEFWVFYEVEIEFDDNDIVKRCEIFKLPREKASDQK
jgi:hypothetical protein